MTAKLHSLLKRQLKKHFRSVDELPTEMRQFISAVNEAYRQSDDDRNMLERSLELSSDELLQANSELRAIFHALPDLFFIINSDGKILNVKAGNSDVLLMRPDQLIGKYIHDIYHEEVGRKFLLAIEQLQKGSPLITIEYGMHLSGKVNIFETRIRSLRENQILAIIRNVTKQKEAQQALKESESRYRNVLEASPDPIIVYDMQGRATFINPAFTKVFGWTIDDVYMRKVDYVPEDCRADTEKLIKLASKGQNFTGVETRRLTKSGKMIDVSISAAFWRDLSGETIGSVVTIRDKTEKKELEARLIQAHKMEAIGILAGGIAHDFNNLLMGLRGTASLMLSETDKQNPFYQKLLNMEHYIKSGSDLTRQLLGFAQGGKYEIKPTNVNALIEQSAEMFGRTKKQVRINLDLAEKLWTVEVDQVQIEQVMLNLYVNAWQAMPDGGDLLVRTENANWDEENIRKKKLAPSRYVRISITDTGIGMDEKVLQKIFDPFYTTKEKGKGTGLGLASTYGIIKNHGGSIEVHSMKGHGTTFTIYLPASEKSVAALPALPDQVVPGTGTILLIDDEAIIREVGEEMLLDLGYEVLVAASGKEGLQLFETRSVPIDMVILDLIMPGIGGKETFHSLRKIDPRVKVLLSSGYSVDGQVTAILQSGCNGFIQKPFDLKQLSRKIREVLET